MFVKVKIASVDGKAPFIQWDRKRAHNIISKFIKEKNYENGCVLTFIHFQGKNKIKNRINLCLILFKI